MREKHDISSSFNLLSVIDNATRRKNSKENESDEEYFFNDTEMDNHGTKDDLKIQIDIDPKNSKSFELNNIVLIPTMTLIVLYMIMILMNAREIMRKITAIKLFLVCMLHQQIIDFEFVIVS